jgi:pimeloyl-ACP methyl ester carboxylesterase
MMLAVMPAAGAKERHKPSGAIEMEGELRGAPYTIRVPENWNGTLVVYAHGYRDKFDHPFDTTDRSAPGGSDAEAAPGGDALEDVLLSMGYAVAGSLYSDDGWAVKEGIADTRRLVNYFNRTIGMPEHTILWGFSMGSVVTFYLAEHPGTIDGFIPACGLGAGAPANWDIGLGLAVAFDAAFGWPAEWGTVADVRDDLDFETEVFPVLLGLLGDQANQPKFEFMRLVNDFPESFYSEWLFTDMFFATEARAEMERRAGGPVQSNYGHTYTVESAEAGYLGSIGADVDGLLDAMNDNEVRPDRRARRYVRRYADYTGRINRPVLTMHSAFDGLVLTNNESVYKDRVEARNRSHNLLQVFTEGDNHCDFSGEQLVTAVSAMSYWLQTGNQPPAAFFSEAAGFIPGFQPPAWAQPVPIR